MSLPNRGRAISFQRESSHDLQHRFSDGRRTAKVHGVKQWGFTMNMDRLVGHASFKVFGHDVSLAVVSLLDLSKVRLSHLKNGFHDSFGFLGVLVAQHLVPCGGDDLP